MAEHSHPDLERAVGRIEGNVEGLGKSLDVLRQSQESGFREIKQGMHEVTVNNGKQNSQIGKLKGKHQWIVGGLAMLVFLTPLAILVISYFT